MTRLLRRRHRLMVCALGLLVPLAFVLGLAARRPIPFAASLPAELAAPPIGSGEVVWTKADLWPNQRIVTSLRRNAAGIAAVELMFRDLTRPDVLVYWMARNEPAGGRLPEDARLLGALSNRVPLLLPTEVQGQSGRFVLYSLADQEVVVASRPLILRPD